MRERTQAGYVLVLTAALDQMIRDELKKRLVPISATLERRIFDGYGPLSTIASRIDMARALGVYDDTAYHKLRTLNQIRVLFAHSPTIVTFSTPEVMDHMSRLLGGATIGDPSERFEKELKELAITISGYHPADMPEPYI